jgi:hypothetical protein
MYRALFGLFAVTAPIALLMCLGNLLSASRTWYRKRPSNGLGAFTARWRFYWQLTLFGFCLCLNALVTAVFLFSDPGNAPRNASGWVLYGVLWFFLVGTTFLSVGQRYYEHRIKSYPAWDGTERRTNDNG